MHMSLRFVGENVPTVFGGEHQVSDPRDILESLSLDFLDTVAAHWSAISRC